MAEGSLRTDRGRLLYWAYRAAVPVAGVIPARLAYAVLDQFADAAWLLNGSVRRIVEANLRRVIGTPNRRWRRAVRGVFRTGVRNYWDTLRIPNLSDADVRSLVHIRGWQHLDAALARGRGAILVGAHLSSLALTTQAFAANGYRVNVAVEPIDPPELLELLTRLRAGRGMQVVPLGPRLGTQFAAALRRGEPVALIVDRDVTGSGVQVPFFGAPARLPSGPALLALRSQAPILPAAAIRRADARFEGVIEAPIPISRSGDVRADVVRITEAIAARLEYYIRRHPEQWTAFQPVWGSEG